MSAPQGNQNRTTHGVRGFLALGSLPAGARYIRRLIGELRTALESAVSDSNGGEISIYHGALIQSACRHEGRALLLGRYLRMEENLSLSDRLSVLKEIGTASDSRDKCLKLLGLDDVAKIDPIAVAIADADRQAKIASAAPRSPEGSPAASEPTMLDRIIEGQST